MVCALMVLSASLMPSVPATRAAESDEDKRDWQIHSELQTGASVGVMRGEGSIPGTAGIGALEAILRTGVERGRFRLDVPVELSHRQALGTSFSKSVLRSSVEAKIEPVRRIRISAAAGLLGVWKPDWPDLYQPDGRGGLLSTDRYSHLDRWAAGRLSAGPFLHQMFRLSGRTTISDYKTDPHFEPIGRPNHIAPKDFGEREIEGSWKYLGRSYKIEAGLQARWRDYYFLFARDARSSLTHARSSTQPPNPLYAWRQVEPHLELDVDLWSERADLTASYGYESRVDLFQGYYSFTGHHPTVRLRWRTPEGFAVTARGELWWRAYGANSYVPGSFSAGVFHPPLTFGHRRVDRRAELHLEAELPVGSGWFAIAKGRYIVRRTNFPPFRAGEFPAGASYNIDWDYDNWLATFNIEYRLRSD